MISDKIDIHLLTITADFGYWIWCWCDFCKYWITFFSHNLLL